MGARIIDGKAHAARLRAAVQDRVKTFEDKHGRAPGLAVVLTGDNPASEIYVRNKVKQATLVGVRPIEHRLPHSTSETDFLRLVEHLNSDPAVDGILVQLPLPEHIDPRAILGAINPAKDVDGFHPQNVGANVVGVRGIVPCTPLEILMLLREVAGDLTGAHAVVIGTSNIVGKPTAALLLQEKCTVTSCHIDTRDTAALARQADILVSSAGHPGLVRRDWVKPGAIVVDVGINRVASPRDPYRNSRMSATSFSMRWRILCPRSPPFQGESGQ